MSDLNSERSKAWNIYTAAAAAASNPGPSHSQTGVDEEAPWKSSFGTSMSAISFGFVATAILISMFVIMAIFEHLFKPTSPQPESMLPSYHQHHHHHHHQEEDHSLPTRKQGNNAQSVTSTSYGCDLSVMMPGQQYPTYIAQPAPLPPCPREGAFWPSHQHQHHHLHHHFVFN